MLLDGARRRFDRYEAAGLKWTKDAGPCEIEEARLRVADPDHPWYRMGLRRAGSYKALNAVIQGDSARWTKQWLCDVYYQTGIVPLLQMHDSLSFSVKNFEQAEMAARIGCEAIALTVPIRVDMGFGRTWGEASRKDAASWAELTGDTAPGHDAKYVIVPARAAATAADAHRCRRESHRWRRHRSRHPPRSRQLQMSALRRPTRYWRPARWRRGPPSKLNGHRSPSSPRSK